VKLSKIKPNPNNPRQITAEAVQRLAESIERDPEFMELRPIIVDADGIIVAGNQRYRAIKQLGKKEIPDEWVRQADTLTEEQRRRFILVDNSIPGMSGDWDVDLLANEWELPELQDMGFSLDDLGLDIQEEEMPEMSNREKAPIQQMTFTLHDEQVEVVKDALQKAKDAGPFVDTGNENSNGNALARIAEAYRG